jgi:hypothetical protein
VRQVKVWAPEGFCQPRLRPPAADPRRLEPGTRGWLKDELFGNHLLVRDQNSERGDQLTRELQHFVECVQRGSRPRAGK